MSKRAGPWLRSCVFIARWRDQIAARLIVFIAAKMPARLVDTEVDDESD